MSEVPEPSTRKIGLNSRESTTTDRINCLTAEHNGFPLSFRQGFLFEEFSDAGSLQKRSSKDLESETFSSCQDYCDVSVQVALCYCNRLGPTAIRNEFEAFTADRHRHIDCKCLAPHQQVYTNKTHYNISNLFHHSSQAPQYSASS